MTYVPACSGSMALPGFRRAPDHGYMRRLAPAFVLFFLAPFVAEYVLGDFPVTYLPLILFLAPMYGGGAILVREVARRTGRGWPTMLLLALAYGVFEEGITTESLFDPDYAHAHLLDRGFVPALGIAVPWTLFVLTLHTVWSIGVPIALTEGFAPARRTTPWLRTPGLVVTTALFLVGSVFTVLTSYRTDHFRAPWSALGVVLALTAALCVAAFLMPQPKREGGRVPSPWWVFAATLVAGAVFRLGFALPTWFAVAAMLAALAGTTVAVLAWSRRAGWDDRHRLALAGGALLTYAWNAFLMHPVVGDGPVVTPVSHVVFGLMALALLGIGLRRLPRRTPEHIEVSAPTVAAQGT